MEQYKIIIIYAISDDERKKSFEDELEKYGLERLGEQDIFALPLDEYRTKVQAFKAYLRLFAQASGQSGHSIVRGVTHESGTDPDYYVANQSDE